MPISGNLQRVRFPGLQRGSDFLQRTNPAFNASGIEKQRQPRHGRIPKLFINFEKRKLHIFALTVAQMNVVIDMPAAHRRGKLQIELEQVLRKFIR